MADGRCCWVRHKYTLVDGPGRARVLLTICSQGLHGYRIERRRCSIFTDVVYQLTLQSASLSRYLAKLYVVAKTQKKKIAICLMLKMYDSCVNTVQNSLFFVSIYFESRYESYTSTNK